MACLCLLSGCGQASGSRELSSALDAAPGIAPRLSLASSFRACAEQPPPDGTIPRAHCPAPRNADPGRLTEVAQNARRAGDDPRAQHTLAVLDLVVADERGIALDRAITSLRRLAARVDRPAAVLADLAAALIVRAERTQAPRDLLEAYETAEQALRHDPRDPAALYNRALALDRFGLVDEAAADWAAYLTADSTSAWADDARRRREVALAVREPAPPPDDAPLHAYAAYAGADPQGARELGMDRLLGEWGEAVEAGDSAGAARLLDRVAALGDALARRPGGDATLADMVRAIRAAAESPALLHDLARAHGEYIGARRDFDAYEFARAEPRFDAAIRAAEASPVLRQWISVYQAPTWLQLGRVKEGERLLAATAADADPRHPALAARARWPLGRSLGRRERWEPALEELRESARLFSRAGEVHNEAAALSIAAEIRFVLGEPDAGYAALHRGLATARPYRGSVRLHTMLVAAATEAAADGLLRAAVRLQGEGVRVALRNGNPSVAVEARLERARYLAAAGDLARARADLDTARPAMRAIAAPRAREWFQAHLREAEAVVSLAAQPDRSARALDSAAAFFARVQVPTRVLPALVAGAEARLAAGDAEGATRRLERAIRLLEGRRDSIRMEPRRAAVFDAARAVVDRLVMLKLADGRPAEALAYLDRARASLAPAGQAADGGTGVSAPPGEVVVEYARVADTLLAWTVAGDRVQVSRTVVDTIRLARTLQGLEAALRGGASEAETRPALSLLYDWIVRPVERTLGRAGTPLVMVADGEVATVPFAALFDGRRGRYLVEDHPLRFAVSLREARRQPPVRPADGTLFVADPAFDRRAHPLLEPLAHAREEVRAITADDPRAVVLEGAAATAPAVASALARAGIVHFAGHAVFDDQRPERSHLVLAGPGAAPGRLTAAELARLDLRHVRLVVLSACRTVRSASGRAGGFTGLSGALLAAGAGGTVGSTWEVQDRFTAALMVRFHRDYRTHGDGPRALRNAQLALLRSANATLRTPAAWAGFRYAGR